MFLPTAPYPLLLMLIHCEHMGPCVVYNQGRASRDGLAQTTDKRLYISTGRLQLLPPPQAVSAACSLHLLGRNLFTQQC